MACAVAAEAGLWQGQRERRVGADAHTGAVARRGVDARWDIERQNTAPARVRPGDQRGGGATGRFTQPVTNQGVDDEVRLLAVQGFEADLAPSGRTEDRSLPGRHGPKPVRLRQDEPHVEIAVRQMARRADATSTIAAPACQDDDLGAAPGVAEQHEGLRREIPPRVLHHLKEVRPRLFNRHAIDLSHLVGRDGLDRDSPVGQEARRHWWRAYSGPEDSKVIILTGACQARIRPGQLR